MTTLLLFFSTAKYQDLVCFYTWERINKFHKPMYKCLWATNFKKTAKRKLHGSILNGYVNKCTPGQRYYKNSLTFFITRVSMEIRDWTAAMPAGGTWSNIIPWPLACSSTTWLPASLSWAAPLKASCPLLYWPLPWHAALKTSWTCWL